MLREYGEYIENFNSILSKNKGLENQKIEIENMQSQLKKLEGSINPDHARELQLLKEKYLILQGEIKKATDTIDTKKAEMIQIIEKELVMMSRGIKTLELTLMKDNFVNENCPAQ